jgi:acyl dehydratase
MVGLLSSPARAGWRRPVVARLAAGRLAGTFYQPRPGLGRKIHIKEVRMPQRVIDATELPGLVGQEVGLGDWFTVTQGRIDAFAEATEDRQWIHCDAGRARAESPYGTPIAHGYLTLSLLSHLLSQAVRVSGPFSRVINYGPNRVRFPAAVPAGGRVRARCTLQAAEPVPGGLQVTWAVTVECEGQPKPAVVAESLARLYSDTQGSS